MKRALPTTPTPRRQKEKMKGNVCHYWMGGVIIRMLISLEVPDDADIIEISSSDEVFPPSNQQASQKKPIEKTSKRACILLIRCVLNI